MKKIYLILLVIAVNTFNFSLSAQSFGNEQDEFNTLQFNLEDFPKKAGDEEFLPDITFGQTVGSVLDSEAAFLYAYNKELDEWFARQYDVFKKEIERQLNQTFQNYNKAKDAYFKHIERKNVRNQVPFLKNKYQSRVSSKTNTKRRSLNNLKLLDFRETEINIGNINNSNYADFTFNNTPIGQITSISQLNSLRNQGINLFQNNEAELFNDTRTRANLAGLDILNNGSSDHPILNSLLALHNNHYNSYTEWDQLPLMVLYLNNVRESLVVTKPIQAFDFGRREYVEDFSTYKGHESVFSPGHWLIAFNQLRYQLGDDVASQIAKQRHAIAKEEALLEMLGTITEDGIRTQNLIENLGYQNNSTEAIWLNNNEIAGGSIQIYVSANSGIRTTTSFAKKLIGILMNDSLSLDEKLNLAIALDEACYPLPTEITENNGQRILKEYSDEFRRHGKIEFADYLDSIFPINESFKRQEFEDLLKLIKKEKVRLFFDYIYAIGNVVVDSFQPVIEYALWEVGGAATLKLLSKLPTKWLTTPIKNVITRLRSPSSKAFESLKHAKKFGFRSYDDFVKYFKDNNILRSKFGIEIHHLFEKRLAQSPAIRNFLGSDTGKWKSILLDKKLEHLDFSAAWQKAIGYKGHSPGWTGFNSDNVTVEAMKRAAREIYKDYPEILKALGL